jgi:hypothetical protein
MEYRISNICSDLSIGKSTVYKRIELLKQSIPETDWKKNDYFYYTENNKLFFTEKGFEYIKNFNNKNSTYNARQVSTNNEIVLYQNQIIEIYKQRIEYLESENKRLLDIISVKEQKELAKDMKYIGNNENVSFWDKLFYKFKKS